MALLRKMLTRKKTGSMLVKYNYGLVHDSSWLKLPRIDKFDTQQLLSIKTARLYVFKLCFLLNLNDTNSLQLFPYFYPFGCFLAIVEVNCTFEAFTFSKSNDLRFHRIIL